MQVKALFSEAVLIFITTPTFEELERRLRFRSSESEDEIQKRLENARWELTYLPRYDYEVVNDQVARATRQLEAILVAESLRILKPKH